jgi:hypothetical protein
MDRDWRTQMLPDISPSSFRDPAGYVFVDGGVVKRAVTVHGEPDYRRFIGSGLYQRLVKESLLVAHEEKDAAIRRSPEVATVLVPEQILTISYPYEWCFGQLRDAALLTLRLEKHALEHGMTLKDASAFNVQFRGSQPIFIDTLSFEADHGGPWLAYNQFCRHFLAPLALMSYLGPMFHQCWKPLVDGVPLDCTSALLPRRTYLRFGLLVHIHLHARSQQRYSQCAPPPRKTPKPIVSGVDRKQALVESLQATIQGLRVSGTPTEWSDYYRHTSHYSPESEARKKEIVSRMIERARPALVYDLGGNTGEYGRLATDAGAACVCFDVDPQCVQSNYERSKAAGDLHMLPLLMDLTNPTPPLGFHLRERLSLLDRGRADLLLALAVIHHLRITGNVPFLRIAAFLADLGERLIVEYVPKQDVMVRRLLQNRKDSFFDYEDDLFLRAFQEHFVMEESVPISASGRTIYLFRRGIDAPRRQ